MDSHVIRYDMEETAYTKIMGHMDVISIISDYFNVYFPIALLALTLATYFSLGARLLTMLGFQQFLGIYFYQSHRGKYFAQKLKLFRRSLRKF